MAFTGYSINGVPLQNDAYGWKILREGTQTNAGMTNTLSKVPVPGRPGYNPAPSTYTEQLIIFAIRTPRTGLEALLTLAAAATSLTRTDDPTKEMYVELASALTSGDAPMDSMFDVTISLSGYQGVYRDVTSTITGPTVISTPTATLDVFAAMSAPIFEADIFMRGQFGQFVITDAGGSVLKTISTPPGQLSTNGILWLGASQQAFVANESSPFTPLTDASAYVDQSANGGFRIMPQMVSGNPTVRKGTLTITTLTQTSTTIRVRGKAAYRMN